MPNQSSRTEWSRTGIGLALGALVLLTGLLLGPTPGDEPAEALRRIDEVRGRYVATNGIDFVGILVMTGALLAVARRLQDVQGEARAPFLATLGGAATFAGGVLMAVVLTIESAPIPDVAERFVAGGADAALHLAVGEALLEVDAAVFGIGLMLEMVGVAALAGAFRRGAGPSVDWRFLATGVALSGLAGLTGLAFLFEPIRGFGRLEPALSLAALVWLVALGGVLAWRGRGAD